MCNNIINLQSPIANYLSISIYSVGNLQQKMSCSVKPTSVHVVLFLTFKDLMGMASSKTEPSSSSEAVSSTSSKDGEPLSGMSSLGQGGLALA